MSPSYEIIKEYQRLKMLLTKIFYVAKMKYESMKYDVIIWKIRKVKIAHFRRRFYATDQNK